MKKLMKKKVNVFGKSVPVFLIALIAVTGFVSAALLTYFGVITGSVTVSQGLFLDDLPWNSDDASLKYSEAFTSLEAKTASSGLHYLKNTAGVATEVKLVTTCKDASAGDCDSSVITTPIF